MISVKWEMTMAGVNTPEIHKMKQSLWAGSSKKISYGKNLSWNWRMLRVSQRKGRRQGGETAGRVWEHQLVHHKGGWKEVGEVVVEEWVRLYTTTKWMLNFKVNYESNFTHVNEIEWVLHLHFSVMFKISALEGMKLFSICLNQHLEFHPCASMSWL